jgi:beta-glucanase (GH16 family)
MMSSPLFLLLITLSVISATPWDQLLSDLPSVRYGDANIACTCSSSSRTTNINFKSQEGYSFTFNAALAGDCTNPVTSLSLTSATQSLTQAMFFVQYDGQCPLTQDCSQVRCQATSPGSSTLSCSFTKPTGYTSKMYVYILWQTSNVPGNRQYPLPAPAFIPLNMDCNAQATYTSTCNNGVCGCNTGDVGSTCPVPTAAPATVPPTVAPTTSPVTSTTPPVITATTPPTAAPTSPPTGPKLIFQDEFTKLDFSVWEHELTLAGDGNGSFQQYTNNRTNSFVRNGVLYIKPTLTSAIIGEGAVAGNPSTTVDLASLEPAMQCTGGAFWGCSRTSTPDIYMNPIQSAALRTAHSFSFKYGRVEVKAKLPRGDWIWPAIWLLPRWAEYGQWPMSGEIDIMESRGNAPGYAAKGSDYFGSTLHFGPYWPQDRYDLTHQDYQLPAGQSFADAFHIFGLYWDATGLYTYIDNDANKVLKVNWTVPTSSGNYFYDKANFGSLHASNPWQYGSHRGAPFDQEFYIILDVAVGGAMPGVLGANSYFPDDSTRPWRNDQFAMRDFWNNRGSWLPTWQGDDVAMQVDWVRVWQ